MPIVTNPLLTSWQAKFQKLMEGRMNLIELTKQRVQERLNTQKLDRQDLLGRLVALRDDKNVTIDRMIFILPPLKLCNNPSDSVKVIP